MINLIDIVKIDVSGLRDKKMIDEKDIDNII